MNSEEEKQHNVEKEHEDDFGREDEGFFKFAENCWNFYDHRTLLLIGF
jgi:hypothetical protein